MAEGLSPNARRWLDTIAFAEGTWGEGAPRYDITFGYQPIRDLSRHPNRVVKGGGYSSAAAGAYQFTPATWDRVKKTLGLSDFGPQAQDQAALQLMRWRGVDPDRDPITPATVAKLAGEWASLPDISGKSAYGQPVKSFESLKRFADSRGSYSGARTTSQDKARYTPGAAAVLLDQIINSMTPKGGSDLTSQAPTPNVPLPSYEEDALYDTDNVQDLLKLYTKQKEEEQYREYLEASKLADLQRNFLASQQAQSRLLNEALSAFKNPTQLI